GGSERRLQRKPVPLPVREDVIEPPAAVREARIEVVELREPQAGRTEIDLHRAGVAGKIIVHDHRTKRIVRPIDLQGPRVIEIDRDLPQPGARVGTDEVCVEDLQVRSAVAPRVDRERPRLLCRNRARSLRYPKQTRLHVYAWVL